MTADALLTVLTNRGVTVRIDGDALYLRPRSRVTTDLLAKVQEIKDDLLTRLRDNHEHDPVTHRVSTFCEHGAPWVLVRDLPYERGRCYSCAEPLLDVLFGRCVACSEALWRVVMNDDVTSWPGRPH